MTTSEFSGLPDEELVRLAMVRPETPSGRRAVEELLGRYRRVAYLWCYRRSRNHEQALDLAQEALLDAWRGLGSFEGRSRFSTWLFLIVRNRCLTALRRRVLQRDENAELDELSDPRGDPESLMIQDESGAQLERLLVENLNSLEQDAIWLRCVECLSVDEITLALGVRGASGARGLLQTARRKLRSALGRGEKGITGEDL